jgi:hypothetical protein
LDTSQCCWQFLQKPTVVWIQYNNYCCSKIIFRKLQLNDHSIFYISNQEVLYQHKQLWFFCTNCWCWLLLQRNSNPRTNSMFLKNSVALHEFAILIKFDADITSHHLCWILINIDIYLLILVLVHGTINCLFSNWFVRKNILPYIVLVLVLAFTENKSSKHHLGNLQRSSVPRILYHSLLHGFAAVSTGNKYPTYQYSLIYTPVYYILRVVNCGANRFKVLTPPDFTYIKPYFPIYSTLY